MRWEQRSPEANRRGISLLRQTTVCAALTSAGAGAWAAAGWLPFAGKE